MRGYRNFSGMVSRQRPYRRICQTTMRCCLFKRSVLSVMETVKGSAVRSTLSGIDYWRRMSSD